MLFSFVYQPNFILIGNKLNFQGGVSFARDSNWQENSVTHELFHPIFSVGEGSE